MRDSLPVLIAARNRDTYCVPVTQQPKRKPRPGTDEGALYTSLVVAEVKRLRSSKTPAWSAERLAAEMTAAGVPWTRDSVVNLENGRRKRIAAHELLALAYVLDLDSPVDLLAPRGDGTLIPATPGLLVTAAAVRAWCERKIGPLRQWLEAPEQSDERLAELRATVQAQVDRGEISQTAADDIVRMVITYAKTVAANARTGIGVGKLGAEARAANEAGGGGNGKD